MSNNTIVKKDYEKEMKRLKQKLKADEKRMQKNTDRMYRKREALNKKVIELQKRSHELWYQKTTQYYDTKHKIQDMCDHSKYPVRKRENQRDDRSFVYWVFCSNCDAEIGHTDN